MKSKKSTTALKTQEAMFAMGCFWNPDILFSKLKGVKEVKVGNSGGKIKNPTYEQVCSGVTEHAEVVKIWFNGTKISYKELLDIFWKSHNPTTLNSQGPDFGTQYRSAIFYFDDKQKKEALFSLKKAQKEWKNKIVTEILPAKEFYEAEDYHQKYLEKHGSESCHI